MAVDGSVYYPQLPQNIGIFFSIADYSIKFNLGLGRMCVNIMGMEEMHMKTGSEYEAKIKEKKTGYFPLGKET